MGCDYINPSIKTFKNELITEIVTTRQDLFSKKRKYKESSCSNLDKKIFNLDSKRIDRELEIKLYQKNNIKKSYTLKKYIKNSELYNKNQRMTRLSYEKFNELFDDNNIKYNKNKKNFKSFSFKSNNYNFNFSKNYMSTNLSSIIEDNY